VKKETEAAAVTTITRSVERIETRIRSGHRVSSIPTQP
jgi:hypothetical protein